jgi:membrane-bound lytic murein transglycosylase B
MNRAFAVLAALSLPALIAAPQAQAPAVQAPAPQAPAAPAQTFNDWLEGVRTEALAKGISQATIDRALGHLEPLPVVVERDRSQPEEVLTLDTYVSQHVTAKTVRSAQAVARQRAALLRQVSQRYGVPGPVIVAVWGLESNFGKFTGSRPVVAALATLGYDGRRALFRAELFEALRILDKSHMAPEDLKGSWAGAMGQPQFMPSSYLQYAVDFDQDGRTDIWKSEADVFASIANYLNAHGWVDGERWGREVRVPAEALDRIGAAIPLRTSGCQAERAMTEPRVLSEWKALGVTLAGGGALPASDLRASLVRGDKRFFLVYRNYDAIIGYNCAHPYAISVGVLADKVGGG